MFEPIDRVMNMRKGGSAVAPRRTVIGGQDHMLSYITPQEGEILMALGGSGNPGPMGIPSFQGGDDGPNFPTFYRVPVGTPAEGMQESRKIYIGSSQDTMENRIAGSSDLASAVQDEGPGYLPQAVNRAEYLRQYERDLAALQGRPDPYPDPDPALPTLPYPVPDPEPVVPDPVAPVNPSDVIVDPVDVTPALGNIGSDAPTYQPFRPDFTPPPVLSIQDVISNLPPLIPSSTYQPFRPNFGPSGFANFAQGGAVEAPRRTDIRGQDHMLSYITPQEGEILMALGGSGEPGPMGIPAYIGDNEGGQSSSGASEGDVGGPGAGAGDNDDGGFAGDDTGQESSSGSYGGGSSNDSGSTGISPGRSQAEFGTIDFAGMTPGRADMASRDRAGRTGNYGGYEDDPFGVDQPGTGTGVMTAQNSFNTARGITDKNPYGYQGFFSRVFGLHPSKVDYSGIMGLDTRRSIANNQFSKFANPTNTPGKLGYNPAFATAKPGQLRAGVQKAGYNTVLGPVEEYAVQRSPMDMGVLAGLSALNAPMGLLANALTSKTYGVAGIAPPDAAPPGAPQSLLGQIAKGVTDSISGAYQSAKEVVGDLVDRMTPEQIDSVAKATPEQKAQIQAQLQGPPELTQMDTTQGLNQTNVAFGLDFPGTEFDTTGRYSTNVGTSEQAQKAALDQAFQGYNTAAPRAALEAQQAKDVQALGLASLGLPDELSGVPMSGSQVQTLGSLVDTQLPAGAPIDTRPAPRSGYGLTPSERAFQELQESLSGGGDGGPEESETDSSGDTAFVNYQPTVSGGYYDYGKQGPYDGRLIIPTEEILSNRKYFA